MMFFLIRLKYFFKFAFFLISIIFFTHLTSSADNMELTEAHKLLVKKDWQYEGHGIMDKTHLRFFTNKSIKTMYKDAGYTITTHEGINKTKSIRPLLFNIPLLFTQMDMLNLQYATVAKFDR